VAGLVEVLQILLQQVPQLLDKEILVEQEPTQEAIMEAAVAVVLVLQEQMEQQALVAAREEQELHHLSQALQ
jgi:hypothetical protein